MTKESVQIQLHAVGYTLLGRLVTALAVSGNSNVMFVVRVGKKRIATQARALNPDSRVSHVQLAIGKYPHGDAVLQLVGKASNSVMCGVCWRAPAEATVQEIGRAHV